MKRFLSLILAVTLVVSLFTVNVMAASKEHSIAITADKTTGLKAGDTVTVELRLDNTGGLVAMTYRLDYDTDVFTAETVKVSKVEKCIDKTWLTNIKLENGGTDGDYWQYYMGDPTISFADGLIKVVWAGGKNGGVGTDDPTNEIIDNKLVGKFYLTVNENVTDGDYKIGLVGDGQSFTGDFGENSTTDLTATPVTVTVGSGAPTPATPEFDGATGNVTEDGKIGVEGTKEDGTKVTYDNAYSVSVSMKNGENADKVGVKFIPSAVLGTNNNDWASAAEAVFTSGLGDGVTGFTAALINIPAKFRETGIEIQARAFMVVGGVEKLDENIVKKTVKWDITADRD